MKITQAIDTISKYVHLICIELKEKEGVPTVRTYQEGNGLWFAEVKIQGGPTITSESGSHTELMSLILLADTIQDRMRI